MLSRPSGSVDLEVVRMANISFLFILCRCWVVCVFLLFFLVVVVVVIFFGGLFVCLCLHAHTLSLYNSEDSLLVE